MKKYINCRVYHTGLSAAHTIELPGRLVSIVRGDASSVIDYYTKTMEQVDSASRSYGMDAESLIGMSSGMDLAAFKEQLMNDSITFIEHSTLYKAIADRENITATQEDIERVASENGYAGKTDEFVATYGEDMIRDYILEDKLLDFFLELK